jgi:hypothetical protein
MDRIVSSYLATHRQATLGKTSLFDLLNWSNSRCKWPSIAAAAIPATTASPTALSRSTALSGAKTSPPRNRTQNHRPQAEAAMSDAKPIEGKLEKTKTRAAGVA